ncbi:RagB/SusD family nutrient uptake outer membrane protein [Gelidibacter japonicus]|uniref:RagB/SusD family nutrient uptake outer membrane protein n=1 Tax=Gelidibacter japonicus TaxID=1962232 RepID=UPI002020A651|nr:RagB/SusD family nutrient uptake outer membrane protein [Gelidibacter japonicus]MCL8006951.1 RagB/SusD family nutrient uptake outer membrane protein [Gelidibacter japonicus]
MNKIHFNKSLKPLLFLLVFIATISCNNDLEEVLKGDLSESTIKTQSDAIALVDGIYNGLLDGGFGYYASGSMAYITDGITDVFKLGGDPGLRISNLEQYRWGDDNIANDPWGSIYKVIDRANWALKLIEGMDDEVFKDADTKNRLLGEASFLRGLAYFDLVGIYGGVPLKLKPTESDGVGLSRSSTSDVYIQIEKDLNYAIENLAFKGGSPGRANKAAAHGILAKALLRQGKWDEAKVNIDAIIASGAHDLFVEGSFLELFYESNRLDNEIIFSVLSMGESYYEATNHHIKFFTPWNYDTGWSTVGMPPTLFSQIEPGDSRLEVYFDVYPTFAGGTENAIEQYNLVINRKFGHYNRDITAPGYGYDAYKNYAMSKLGVPILRYSDVLLLKADIENELNGPNAEAYSAINQVRNRAGLGDLPEGLGKSEFTEAVLKERAIELAAEGHRKDDLIRHNIFESTMTQYLLDQGYAFPVTVTPAHKLMPIPRTELDLNPNMDPNPSNDF